MVHTANTPEASPSYVEDIPVLLSRMAVPEPAVNRYLDFLQNSTGHVNDEVRFSALALGRLYFVSLQGSREKYSFQEQTMIGFATGRTIQSDPVPVERAAADFAAHFHNPEPQAQIYVRTFATGVRKLRERTIRNPELYEKGRAALAQSCAKLGVPMPKPGRTNKPQ